MRHVDPASEAFTLLPRRQRGRIYLSYGWSIEAVADELEVQPATVRDWLAGEKYEQRLARKRVTEKKRHRPIQMYEGGKISSSDRMAIWDRRAAGEKLEAIAADYGVSITTIYHHTKALPKPNGRWPTGPHREIDYTRVVELRQQGLTLCAIAKQLGAGKTMIGRICQRLDVKRGRKAA